MKCPKCHYLSFDPEPRCRNCGYDLELTDDLALKTAEDAVEGPLADLTLREQEPRRRAPITLELVHTARAASAAESRPRGAAAAVVDKDEPAPPVAPAPVSRPDRVASPSPVPGPAPIVASPPEERREPPSEPPRAPSTTPELPLFVKGLAAMDGPVSPGSADRPMIPVPPVPRAPLSVRRSSPEPPRSRPRSASDGPQRKPGPLDRDLLEDLRRVERQDARRAAATSAASQIHAPADDDGILGSRLAAAAIDGVLLGGIGLVVVFFTLRLCGLGFSELGTLPLLPIAAFLLIVTVGYLLMFTIAGGQTVGKMAMGIRVVGAVSNDGALPVKQAAYRELLSVPFVLALGAGYVPALIGRGQAVHDRLADTRVVRA